MLRLRRSATLLVLSISSVAAAQERVYRTVNGVELTLTVHAPTADVTASRPAIVFFFGGGWASGTQQQFEPQARYLAKRGMVAITADYRVRSRHGTTPFECVADGRAAMRFVREHASELGVDPLRIAAAGGSAGGHVAACTALAAARSPDRSQPNALVLFNPVLDTGPNGFGMDRIGDRWAELSPIDLLTSMDRSLPPTLILHGTGDRTVSIDSARSFAQAAGLRDAQCTLLEFPGRGHGFFNSTPVRRSRDHAATTRAMDRFLADLGWLNGPPTFNEAPGANEAEAEARDTTTWHGFTRRNVTLGDAQVTVVAPDRTAEHRGWIWRARFFGHQPQTDIALLHRGFHLLYVDVGGLFGNAEAIRRFDRCYDYATQELGLAQRVALEGMSRGGLIVYRWAAQHPDRVACIYADAPVCSIASWPGGQGVGQGHPASWQQCLAAHELSEAAVETWGGDPIDLLEPLAQARVPLLHVCGLDDPVVPFTENTAVLADRYRRLGGSIRVIGKPDVAHHPHSLADPTPIVDFIVRHASSDRPLADDWFTLRGTHLSRTKKAFATAASPRRVAFLGGSITYNPGWRDQVAADLQRRFPKVSFEFVNAGIPSFGSTPGAFRVEQDAFGGKPVDLLFVEAAVNDSTNGRSETEMIRGMEGIIRHVRRVHPETEVVMLHFADPGKIRAIEIGQVPTVIAAHERVARHYRVSSIDLAAEVTCRIAAGEFTWKDDFRNLHPSPFGQKLYADSVRRMLDAAWLHLPAPAAVAVAMPGPLDRVSYDRGIMIAPTATESPTEPGFALDPKWRPSDGARTRAGFVDVPMLVGATPGATASFRFDGRAIGILVNAGPDAGVLDYAIDDGDWTSLDLLTRWSGGLHLPWSHVLATELTRDEHVLRLRVAKPDPARTRGGSAVRIAQFLVNEHR